MKKKMIVFGATGGTGYNIIKQALAKDYEVTAFVRTPEKLKIKHKNLKLFKGDVLNKEDVKKSIQTHDIIFSCIGSKPWAKPVNEKGTKNIVDAMTKNQTLIAESAYGVRESNNNLYTFLLRIIVHSNLIDKDRMEEALEKSKINFTVVRPTILTNKKLTGKYKAGENMKTRNFKTIARADVAHFMLKISESKTQIYNRKFLSISY